MFDKLLSILHPSPKIGGLEITESDLRFILLDGKRIISAGLKLPVGLVSGGVIKDSSGFKKALSELHSKITGRRNKKIPVMLNIPDLNAYTQVFSLPIVATTNLEEAVKLNLQMISPLDFNSAYYGWQKVGESEAEGGQVEILGAFASRAVVDAYLKVITESNFSVVAVEFPILALTRLLDHGEERPSLILLRLSSNGFDFGVIRKKNLYFNHSTPWQNESIYLTELEDLLVRETQRVLNFYSSHWQSPVGDLTLIVPNKELEDKIINIIKRNFPLQIYPFETITSPEISKMNFEGSSLDWLPSLGSAMRGRIPRAKDDIISLSGTSSQETFEQEQTLNFIELWRNIIITSTAAILIFFGAAEGFIIKNAQGLEGRLTQVRTVSPSGQDLEMLKAAAQKFNDKAQTVLSVKTQTNDLSIYFKKIKELAGSDVSIGRIFIQSPDTPIFFSGGAVSQTAVLKFKDAISQDPNFTNIDLPLSAITSVSEGGGVNFTVSFRIKR